MVCDKDVCERWCVFDKDVCVCKMVCERWWSTKICAKEVCDKDVCERSCVTKICVKDVV